MITSFEIKEGIKKFSIVRKKSAKAIALCIASDLFDPNAVRGFREKGVNDEKFEVTWSVYIK